MNDGGNCLCAGDSWCEPNTHFVWWCMEETVLSVSGWNNVAIYIYIIYIGEW